MSFSPNAYIDQDARDLLEYWIVYSALKPWRYTRFFYEVLKNIALCGPSLELGVRISSAEVQKATGLQVAGGEETGFAPGKFTEHSETAILKSDPSFPTIFQPGTRNGLWRALCASCQNIILKK